MQFVQPYITKNYTETNRIVEGMTNRRQARIDSGSLIVFAVTHYSQTIIAFELMSFFNSVFHIF